MPEDKTKLELQIRYLNDDIEEVKRSIRECELTLTTYKSTLIQLEADKKFALTKLAQISKQ